MDQPTWQLQMGEGPLVAAALHDGHAVRDELIPLLAIADSERLREEDPFTGLWTTMAPTRLLGLRSRFELDLNRPREKAVYRTPQDSWGLQVWKAPLPEKVVSRSLAAWDTFYDHVHALLARLVEQHPQVVVFDIHSYNHRRGGPEGPPAPPAENPEVNLGTGSMDRQRWAPIVDRLIHELTNYDYQGRHLDVRENVKFFGGHFPTWIHQTFPQNVCAVAIEFKKFFMDEWTGQPDRDQLFAIGQALRAAAEGVGEELQAVG
ncbi:MAG: N-formylglutamate amidohydrolase [Planctomycetales bacterium]|nr:N-formylglutamate amidohydrolase [Planctomycetales bacterium]NIM09095.1 N-formylglutamate amidohydrolase [Planctomycetales bacterium]NIN08555.1 N-formylglutamate amidohydrolase [Planctomycetales bacterium]NIN77688.1 N-formylglutamate amidohydrolase [Planctomycetales bacterium]NIO34853.1 N-formylglutamate amidohydrolase [Planctomycetales bacterium]